MGKSTEKVDNIEVVEVVATEEVIKEESKFFKSQLLKSETYKHNQDVISACLVDEKEYTQAEINAAIEDFIKGGI